MSTLEDDDIDYDIGGNDFDDDNDIHFEPPTPVVLDDDDVIVEDFDNCPHCGIAEWEIAHEIGCPLAEVDGCEDDEDDAQA